MKTKNQPARPPRSLLQSASGLLKAKLSAGKVSVGSWMQLAQPGAAEIMAAAGFEWITVDLEHSVITIREAEEMIRIIALSGAVPLVRVSSNDRVQIKRIMDAGAAGIIVPMVNTKAEAENAVAAVYYPPRGSRGVGLGRAQGYGAGFDGYRRWLERDCLVVVQIEHIDAVRNLDEILSVEGVDAFIVGSYDLTGSLGIPGQFEHRKMRTALAEIHRVAQRHKRVAPGFHVVLPQPRAVAKRIREGYRFVAYSTDMLFLGEACRTGARAIQKDLARRRTVKQPAGRPLR